jgi:hypothetical protein
MTLPIRLRKQMFKHLDLVALLRRGMVLYIINE